MRYHATSTGSEIPELKTILVVDLFNGCRCRASDLQLTFHILFEDFEPLLNVEIHLIRVASTEKVTNHVTERWVVELTTLF